MSTLLCGVLTTAALFFGLLVTHEALTGNHNPNLVGWVIFFVVSVAMGMEVTYRLEEDST